LTENCKILVAEECDDLSEVSFFNECRHKFNQQNAIDFDVAAAGVLPRSEVSAARMGVAVHGRQETAAAVI
jgi:hypothetical protein